MIRDCQMPNFANIGGALQQWSHGKSATQQARRDKFVAKL
jgi:hypothetical protein